MIAWVYGSGFPKSADVSKHLDAHFKKEWLNVCKSLDNTPHSAIIEAWKEYSNTAKNAGLSFQKNKTATGMNTPKSGFVLAHVLLQANPESSDAVALVAELSLSKAHRTSDAYCNSALSPAASHTTESKSPASIAVSRRESQEATLSMVGSSALPEVPWGWLGETRRTVSRP
jgi:hypothetical protein